MRLFLAAAMIAAVAAPALASPDVPTANDVLHYQPGPEWRAYWVCARRATAGMSNKELAAQGAAPEVEAKCSAEKAAFLLAQIDVVPRDQRVKVASLVDMSCVMEAMSDVLSIEAYRGGADGLSAAPSSWADPNDPLNR